MAGLVDAFHTENAGNFLNIDEDGFELAFIGDFEVGVNARVGAIGAAFQVVNVGTSSADDGGDFGEKAGAVACADGELDGKFCFGATAPLDGDAAFGLVHEILHVGTLASVDGDSSSSRDVADDFVARNGVATLGAVNEQVVVTFNDERRFAEAEHTLDGLDQSGLGVEAFRLFGLFRLTEQASQNLPRGVFSKADGSVEILDLGKSVVGNKFVDVSFRNFLQAASEVARFVFEEALAHFHGFFAFLLVDPMANLAFRRGRFYEAEPIAAGMVALLRKDFDNVAAGDLMAQRHHLSVHFCTDALVPYFRVDHVSKIDRSSAARKFQHAAFGREGVDLDRRKIDFQRGKKFAGFLKLLRPLDQLAHPDDALVVVLRRRLSGFVFPVRGDAFLRDAVHFLRADLHLERLAAVEHGSVQRLIKIRPGNGDVILEPPGDGAPDVVDNAEGRVTIALRIGDHAHGEQIVNLAKANFLAHDFAVH